jgi:hypothetical protein
MEETVVFPAHTHTQILHKSSSSIRQLVFATITSHSRSPTTTATTTTLAHCTLVSAEDEGID